MEKFITRAGDRFEWKQPKAEARSFELTRGGEPFGTMNFRSFWGTLRPPDSRLASWQPLNLWRTQWHNTDTRCFPILSFRQHYRSDGKAKLSEVFKIQAEVQVECSHITNLEYSMLANFWFYLLVMQARDSASIAGVSA